MATLLAELNIKQFALIYAPHSAKQNPILFQHNS